MFTVVEIVGRAAALIIELIVRLMMVLLRRLLAHTAVRAVDTARLRRRVGLRELVVGDLLAGLDVARQLACARAHSAAHNDAARVRLVAHHQRLGLLDRLDAHWHGSIALDHDRTLLNRHGSIDQDWPGHVNDLRSHDYALARHKHGSNDGHVDVARYVDGLLLRLLVRLGHQEDRLDRVFARVEFQITEFVS